jgi:hypothetical protein
MRVSILIHCADPTVSHDYAVVWLDTENLVWSVHAHQGIALPERGDVHEETGVVTLCGRDSEHPLFTLTELAVERRVCLRSTQGQAVWFSADHNRRISGCWHLRAIERGTSANEIIHHPKPRAASASSAISRPRSG